MPLSSLAQMNPSGDVNESVCFDSAQSKSFCLSQSKPPQMPFRSLKIYRCWHHRAPYGIGVEISVYTYMYAREFLSVISGKMSGVLHADRFE